LTERLDELNRLQHWMQAVVTDPTGVQAAVAGETAQRSINVPFEQLEEVVTRSQSLTAAERLAIYSRAYHLRLLDCFVAVFPCLHFALGDELFRRFAIEYLQKYPSRSYTLNQLATRFPKFLAETRPDAGLPVDEQEVWPDFLIDLSRLELAFWETFDGPGVEGRSRQHEDELRGLDWEELAMRRLLPAPCLRLFAFEFPVVGYFREFRAGVKPRLPAPATSHLAMTRQEYSVRLYDLTPCQFEFLRGLIDGQTVLASARAAARANSLDLDSERDSFRNQLCQWVSVQFFLGTAV
jgi:hypothetical protein